MRLASICTARNSPLWRRRAAGRAKPRCGGSEVTLDAKRFVLPAGAALIVPPDTNFSLANTGPTPFEAVVVLPVGGMARLGDQAPFTPPWAA